MKRFSLILVVTIFASNANYAVSASFTTAGKEMPSPLAWRQKAIQETQEIKDQELRDRLYSNISREAGWSGDYASANQCVSMITDRKNKISAYKFLANRCYKTGKADCYESNMQQVRLLTVSGDHPEIYLIGEYLEYNDVKGALSLAETFPDKQKRKSVYHRIAVHLAEKGNEAAAEAISTEKIAGELGKDTILQKVAIATAQEDMDKALVIAGRISQSKERNSALAKIGTIQAEKGNFTGAMDIAQKLEDEQKSIIMAAIIERDIKDEKFSNAEAELKNLSEPLAKIAAHMSIAEAEIHTGLIDSAVKRIRTIENLIKETTVPVIKSKFGSFDSTALMARVRFLDVQIAEELAKRKDIAGYRKHIKLAQDALASVKPEALIMQSFLVSFVVRAQLEAGDIAGAKATIAMPEIGALSREYETNEIVRKLVEAGDTADAIATAEPIKDKAYAYGLISAKLVERGKVTDAIGLVSTADNESIKEDFGMLYEPAPRQLAKTRRQADLVKWIESMPTPEAKIYAYLGAAQGIESLSKDQTR